MADELLAAVAEIDVIDLAGRVIADPRRARVSLAGELALALAVERFWSICIEAELLVNALERAMPWASADEDHAEHVALQMAAVRGQLAALRGETPEGQETDDGNS
jgi:hypothetical protein